MPFPGSGCCHGPHIFLAFTLYCFVSSSTLCASHFSCAVPGSAAQTTVSLRRVSEGENFQSYVPDSVVRYAAAEIGGSPVFEFQEAWEKVTPKSARASGASVLTITGSGFATEHYVNEYSSERLYFHLYEEGPTKYAVSIHSQKSLYVQYFVHFAAS